MVHGMSLRRCSTGAINRSDRWEHSVSDQDLPHLDDSIVQLPADLREDLANQGRNNLYFFAKGIMGFSRMTESTHGPLCTFLDSNESQLQMVLHPRGTYKTSVATISNN